MTTCGACGKAIKSADQITCCRKTCSHSYHYVCANMTSDLLKKQGSWTCPLCTSQRPKGDNSNTPIKPSEQSLVDDSERSNVTIRKQGTSTGLCEQPNTGNDEEELRPHVRNIIHQELSSIVRDLFNKEFKSFRDQLTGLENSIKFINSQYEDIKKLLSANSKEIKSIKDENKMLREDLLSLKARVKQLEDDNMRQQQWTRLQNIELVGIPESSDEETPNIVVKVANYVGVSVDSSDIEFAHRIQPRRGGTTAHPRTIVARLRQRSTKDAIVAAARKKRSVTAGDVGLGGEQNVNKNNKIYINEHLCKENKQLFKQCKLKCKEANYAFVWTKNCRIYVRRNPTSPPILITSTSDLKKIC